MKKLLLKTSFLISFVLLILPARGQDMQEGFKMLEKGSFAQATVFFQQILKDYPTNKTAKICLGRALGLSGEAEKALGLFEELLEKYPSDHEVLLNKAEAHLWLKKPSDAISTYETILSTDSSSFVALMGTANSLSMQQEYQQAYTYIKKAIAVAPTNAQAMISQKYIRLGLANQWASQHQKYTEAIRLVQLNLTQNLKDQESLSLLANIQIMSGEYEAASQAYAQITDPTQRLLGKAIACHLNGQDESALQQVADAHGKSDKKEDIIKVNTTHISALLWNNRITEARQMADSLATSHTQVSDYIASQAEVAMYEADFIHGYESYLNYLKQQPASFKGNLGIADALHALGVDSEAYAYAHNTLKYYPGQQDAKNFIQKLNNVHSPALKGAAGYGRASDGSSYQSRGTGLSASISPLTSITAGFSEKEFSKSGEAALHQSQSLSIGATRQMSQRLKVKATYTSIKMSLAGSAEVTRSDIDLLASARISKVQQLSVGMQTEVQDFNADLLEQNLKTTHLVMKNAMYWKLKGLGWYSEVYHSFFSDGNKRNLLFSSFYKNVNPAIKGGINYIGMGFKESKPTDYFSPVEYHQVELFGSSKLSKKGFPIALVLDAASGCQFTSGQSQFSWRGKAALEKTDGRLTLNVSASYSSISATQAAGFSFTQFNASVKWQLTKKPLFSSK